MKSLIITVSFIAVAATAATIVIGSRTFEGLVVDKPYETGLAWDKTQSNLSHLGWTLAFQKITFLTGANDLYITVTDKDGKKISNAHVQITRSRPSTNRFDQQYEAVAMPGGRYLAKVDLPLYGTWDLIVTIARSTDVFTYEKRIFALKR